ncbi:MAG: dihydroxy-acid dehydratase, partial [Burkholderiaceae bacterium]|nr:dihydroxy-acid dehydratase [Burkholderiaceae bacterium]
YRALLWGEKRRPKKPRTALEPGQQEAKAKAVELELRRKLAELDERYACRVDLLPLALVRTGDRITVDVPARRIHLEVGDDELARRRAEWTAPPPRWQRGYGWLFAQHILQANDGCDFDFLETRFGAAVPEPDIF